MADFRISADELEALARCIKAYGDEELTHPSEECIVRGQTCELIVAAFFWLLKSDEPNSLRLVDSVISAADTYKKMVDAVADEYFRSRGKMS